MTLRVSRSWHPEDIAKASAAWLQTYTPAQFKDALGATLPVISGTHIVCLYHVLDGCVKASPGLAAVILGETARTSSIKYTPQQCPEERAWVGARIAAMQAYWRRLWGGTARLPRRGYFWRQAVQRGHFRKQSTPVAAVLTPAYPEDARACHICGQTLELQFDDAANAWAYTDAVRESDRVRHTDCCVTGPSAP